MTNGTDHRLSTRRWRKFRDRILLRDRKLCQWMLEGCEDYANQVDHIIPRAWDASDAALLDEHNATASCRSCNLKRVHLPPGTYGAYGTRPRGRGFGANPSFRSTRWPSTVVDLTREPGR